MQVPREVKNVCALFKRTSQIMKLTDEKYPYRKRYEVFRIE